MNTEGVGSSEGRSAATRVLGIRSAQAWPFVPEVRVRKSRQAARWGKQRVFVIGEGRLE